MFNKFFHFLGFVPKSKVDALERESKEISSRSLDLINERLKSKDLSPEERKKLEQDRMFFLCIFARGLPMFAFA
jgi:hypothetical protein